MEEKQTELEAESKWHGR